LYASFLGKYIYFLDKCDNKTFRRIVIIFLLVPSSLTSNLS
jgi:hypothetical protein